MAKVTNISHTPQRFTTTTGRRVEIEPGASENLAVSAEDSRVAAKLRAGLITIEEKRPSYKPVQRSAPVKTDEASTPEE